MTANRASWRPALPWHPAAFTIAVVLTAWLDAAVSPDAALPSFLVTVVAVLLLVAIASLALRSFQLGSLAATAIVCLAWSKQRLSRANGLGSRMGVLAVLWILLVGVAAVFVARAVRRRGAPVSSEGVTSS